MRWLLPGTVLLVLAGCSGELLTSGDHDAAPNDGTADGKPSSDGSTADGFRDASADTMDGRGGDSGPPAPCNASLTPAENPCVIADAYGVFVAPAAYGGSDTAGDGSRRHPYATLGNGLTKAHAASKRVYACGASYAEALVVDSALDGVQAYGGLQCPSAGDGGVEDAGTVDSSTGPWSYTGKAASVTPPSPRVALDVESLTKGVHFEDMAFTAQSADPAAPGSASIAVFVNASTGVSFVRCAATARDGAAGAAGEAPPTNWCPTATQAGSSAGTGIAPGGAGGVCVCPIFGSSTGGNGGNESPGPLTPASPGTDGGAEPPTTTVVPYNDGVGGTGYNPPPSGGCLPGDRGATGSAQAGGAMGIVGSLSSSGWKSAVGGAGMPGGPGQGGGGGGGQTPGYGSGAGGGAGGCGGSGGQGGGGGGASFAIAIVSSAVDFTAIKLSTGNGGLGGSGSEAEAGQIGGVAGAGFGCMGGFGAFGAGGSGGGGGAGGPSVGIAWTGTTSPTIDGTAEGGLASLASPSGYSGGPGGAGGSGGAGGTSSNPASIPGNPGTDGSHGVNAAVQSF